MPSRAFVTTRAAHLRAAHGVEGVSRHATAERVSITVRSTGAGLAVVRARYEAGMHAAVGGHAVRALPVDGGLWTAVPIGAGRARIVLDYVTTADLVELALGAAGLATLALLWIALGLCAARRAAQARASR